MGHFIALPKTSGPYQDRSQAPERLQDRSSKKSQDLGQAISELTQPLAHLFAQLKDLPAHEVEGPGDLVCAVVDLLVAGVVLVRVGLDPLVGDYVAGRRL